MSWQDIPGWFNFEDLYDELVETAPQDSTIIEVGSAFGRSVAYLARKVIDSGKRVRVVAVDPWQNEPKRNDERSDRDQMGWNGRYRAYWERYGDTFGVFCGMMLEHAPEELQRITVLRAYSCEAAQMPWRRVHAVFIDADHSYEGVREDLGVWEPHIDGSPDRPRGYLAGHDYSEIDFPGVVQAVKERFRPGEFVVQGTSWVVRP